MAVQASVSERLSFCFQISHVKDYGDVSNALGSPYFESLDNAIRQIVRPQDVLLAKQRFLCAIFVMEIALER